MRVKRGPRARRRRNRVLQETKGFTLGRKNKFRRALEGLQRALSYAFRDRKVRKRDFRRLWNQRIAAAAKKHGTSYSVLMHRLKKAQISLNRKMLSELAIKDPQAFSSIIKKVFTN